MTRDLEAKHVYVPTGWQEEFGHQVKLNHCRHRTYPEYSGRTYQCTRRPRVVIDGFGFCRPHAQQVQADLERA